MPPRMTEAGAETLALRALTYLSIEPDALGRFLVNSGLGPAELKARVADPDLLVAVLDFLLSNETLLVGFCEVDSTEARHVHMARHLLGGA